MANELKKGELFIKEVVARLKGDGAEVTAAKVSRKALSAFEGQIAALKSKKVDQENAVEEAQEALDNATFPTSVFSNNQAYIDNILSAQGRLDQAKENLESTEKALQYFTEKLGGF